MVCSRFKGGDFDISTQLNSNSVVLKGETTLPEAKQALLDSLRSKEIIFADSIDVLPDASVGENYFALVNNSAANLRSEPKHSAQLATQAILGMPLKVLKKQGGWYLVQTPEDYLSWVDGGGIERMDEESYSEWAASEKLFTSRLMVSLTVMRTGILKSFGFSSRKYFKAIIR